MTKSALQVSPGLRPKLLIPILEQLMSAGEPALLRGSPGIGKTDLILMAASRVKSFQSRRMTKPVKCDGMVVHIAHPVVSDPIDFKGMPAITNSQKGIPQAEFLPFGDLKVLLDTKVPLLFFLDDLGQAPAAVQAACMQLLLSRSINGLKVSDLVTFAAATNNKSDKAGVSGILEPVKSRFTTILGVQPHPDDWVVWAAGKGDDGEQNVPDELIAYIKWKPESLNNFQATSEIVNCPSPRTVAALGRLVKLQDRFPQRQGRGVDVRQALYEGAVGAGMAGEFLAFTSTYGKLPDFEKVLANPNLLVVERDRMDICYALAIGLASRAKPSNMKNYMLCLKKFHKDMAVVSITHAVTVKPELQETNEFIQWAIDNQDVWTNS